MIRLLSIKEKSILIQYPPTLTIYNIVLNSFCIDFPPCSNPFITMTIFNYKVFPNNAILHSAV